MASPVSPGDPPSSPDQVLKFEPWQSAVDPTFWAELARRKLDNFGLREDPVPIDGLFACSMHAEVSSPVALDKRSFETWTSVANDALATGQQRAPGTLRNVNTFERFKEYDRGAMLDESADAVWRAVVSGDAARDPHLLNQFHVLTFADLKKWHFTYWFAFPTVKLPEAVRVVATQALGTFLGFQEDPVETSFTKFEQHACDAFAWCVVTSENTPQKGFMSFPLHEFNSLASEYGPENVHVAFMDSSRNPDHPGWSARNLLLLASLTFDVDKKKGPRSLNLIATRKRNGKVSLRHSMVFHVTLPTIAVGGELHKLDPEKRPFPAVGWELNPKGRAGPRRADLGESMDPTRLAVAAAELNLKLMRWRLLPELDLAKISKTKCLLIGAGTLGCSVARCLLGWGVREFTFVDNGKVSFSNPVRQSLFEFSDCLAGGKPKATAAADALARIFPSVNATGVDMSIPMPGHPVSPNETEKVLRDVATLEKLIAEHDVVFCLTDTRESRWLPTLIASATDTLLINCALGFDSYLVMRHGRFGVGDEKNIDDGDKETVPSLPETAASPEPSCPEKLGCYFCNDVMAPGNSTNDRTLDQQCTVTRPGLAPIAGALAAEMLVATLHWAGSGDVPAGNETGSQANSHQQSTTPPTCLGYVPHQIRGNLSTHTQLLFNAPAFGKCTACSDVVVNLFRGGQGDRNEKRKTEFLLAAFADPTFLEDKTGLTKVHEDADAVEWLHSDDELDDF